MFKIRQVTTCVTHNGCQYFGSHFHPVGEGNVLSSGRGRIWLSLAINIKYYKLAISVNFALKISMACIHSPEWRNCKISFLKKGKSQNMAVETFFFVRNDDTEIFSPKTRISVIKRCVKIERLPVEKCTSLAFHGAFYSWANVRWKYLFKIWSTIL